MPERKAFFLKGDDLSASITHKLGSPDRHSKSYVKHEQNPHQHYKGYHQFAEKIKLCH